MNDKSLQQYLEKNNIWYRIIEKEETVHTIDAASAAGVPLNRITKSLVCLTDSNIPIISIIPGDEKLSLKKVARILGVKKVRVCPFEKAHKYSGYPPGATPPIHYQNIEKVIIDEKLMEYETIFGGGGSRKKLLEIKPRDVVELNKATVAGIVQWCDISLIT